MTRDQCTFDIEIPDTVVREVQRRTGGRAWSGSLSLTAALAKAKRVDLFSPECLLPVRHITNIMW